MRQTKWILAFILSLLFLSIKPVKADNTYHMKVGENLSFGLSTSRVVYSAGWWSNAPTYVEVTSSNFAIGKVKALKSRSEPIIIQCDYYFWLTSGTNMTLKYAEERFYVYVDPIEPTSIFIENSKNLEIEDYTTLIPTLTPSNAETTLTWTSNNPSVATVNSDGMVWAKSVGTAKITVSTSNKLSSSCQITVSEPSFLLKKTVPGHNEQNARTDIPISLDFSLPIFVGTAYANISLTDEESGAQTTGSPCIDGNRLIFNPSKTLKSNTDYIFSVPLEAIKNQWGTSFQPEIEIKFKTSVLDMVRSIPENNKEGVALNQIISCDYNTEIQAGAYFDNIQLREAITDKVIPSTRRVSGNRLTISPDMNLLPLTKYKIVIPADALNDNQGISHRRLDTVEFITMPQLTLTADPPEGLIPENQKVTLTADMADASIYYTLDGTDPSESSSRYTDPVVIDQSLTLKAIAFREGYEKSPILAIKYIVSTLKLEKSLPENEAKSVRRDAILAYSFTEEIHESTNFKEIILVKDGYIPVPGEKFLSDNTLYFVSDKLLEYGSSYQFIIPDRAVENDLSEPNTAYTGVFETEYFMTTVSIGSSHAVAIKSGESLWAWGNNDYYQLGDGTTIQRDTPVKIMENVTSVSAGSLHTMAIKVDSSLWTWGNNMFGELGDGTYTSRSLPVKIMDDVVAVSTSNSYTMAIKADSSLWAWGNNNHGQFGDHSTIPQTYPVKIMDGIIAVSTGNGFTMVIKSDHSLWGCGSNSNGQLGNDVMISRYEFLKIMDDVTFVSAGGSHTMAIKSDGSLWGWGSNSNGQLGNSTASRETSPIKIMDGVTTVSAGDSHTMAIKSDESLWGWGSNSNGQLGDGTDTDKYTPVKVMDEVTAVSTYSNTMAIKSNGSLWGWGSEKGSTPILLIDGLPPFLPGTGITLDKGEVHLWIGHKTALLPAIEPLNAEFGALLQWSNDNKEVVSVTQRGVVTAISSGTATITVTLKTKKGESFTAKCKVIVTKAPQEAPSAPIAESTTATSITLIGIPGAEYRLGLSEGWQEEVSFKNLKPDTGYTFYARYKETATHNASPATASEVIYTKIALSTSDVQTNPLRAWTGNGLLYLDGLIIGDIINIYNASGILIYQDTATSKEKKIPLKANGLYIIRVGTLEPLKIMFAN